jgi:hypothetical protein
MLRIPVHHVDPSELLEIVDASVKLAELNHQNLIKFHDDFGDQRSFHIFAEYCNVNIFIY